MIDEELRALERRWELGEGGPEERLVVWQRLARLRVPLEETEPTPRVRVNVARLEQTRTDARFREDAWLQRAAGRAARSRRAHASALFEIARLLVPYRELPAEGLFDTIALPSSLPASDYNFFAIPREPLPLAEPRDERTRPGLPDPVTFEAVQFRVMQPRAPIYIAPRDTFEVTLYDLSQPVIECPAPLIERPRLLEIPEGFVDRFIVTPDRAEVRRAERAERRADREERARRLAEREKRREQKKARRRNRR